jgi:ankyrin repeat protein
VVSASSLEESQNLQEAALAPDSPCPECSFQRIQMASFRYEPIELEGPAFRLMRLLKGNSVESIQCELFDAWLPPVGGGMPYEALSYTWGGTEKPMTIEIGGGEMNITRNLHLALQHLRLEDSDRILWIDAICINQDNIKERGHQVRQMADIYKKAEGVVIWLGNSTDEIDLLMKSMKRLQEESYNHPCHDWKHSDPRWMELWSITQRASSGAHQHITDGQREGLELLLERSWFKRIWILQEVVNAKTAVVVCGTKSVSARIFALTPSLIGVKPKPHCQAVLDIFPGPSRNYSWWSEKQDLHTLLLKFGNSEATDPRDIIYALLGLSSDACDTNLLRADYSMSVQQVISNTISFLLSLNGGGPKAPYWMMVEFLYNLNFLGTAVLRWAISTGQDAVVNQLVERSDIDVEAVWPEMADFWGQMALLRAANGGYDAIVKLLMERSDTVVDVNMRDEDDRTALSWLALRGHDAVMKLLLEHSEIDINLKDNDGNTALSLAASKGHNAVVKLLIEHSEIDKT